MAYMDRLSPNEQETVSTRFSQSPAERPTSMTEEVDKIIHHSDVGIVIACDHGDITVVCVARGFIRIVTV